MIKNQKSQKGFTIIEVALVLAVGALIFLVVFLAVPALQRNQRNDARKRDASSVAEAITSYTSANPSKAVDAEKGDGKIYVAGEESKKAGIGQFIDTLSNNTDQVLWSAATTDINSVGDSSESDKKNRLYVVPSTQCDTGANTLKAGSKKQAAVVYFNETAGGVSAACQSVN